MVVSGSVSVGTRTTLSEGQAFGHGCPIPGTGEGVLTQRYWRRRRGLSTRSPQCQVVFVVARALEKALQEGEKNTQRLEVNGQVVLVTERRLVDQVSILVIV